MTEFAPKPFSDTEIARSLFDLEEARELLDAHGEDELVARTGKYPSDHLATAVATIRQLLAQRREADAAVHELWYDGTDSEGHAEKAIARHRARRTGKTES